MSHDSASDDDVALFLGGESTATVGMWLTFAGVALILLALGLFVVQLLLPPDLSGGPLVLQLTTTMPILGGLALLTLGLAQWRCPTQVDVGPDGIKLYTAFGNRTIAWEDVASLETGERDLLINGLKLKTIRLRDARRKLLVELNSQLEPFDELTAQIERRATRQQALPVVDTTARKRRREAWLLVSIGPAFLALAGFVGWDSWRQIQRQDGLAVRGVAASARITKHYLHVVTPRIEYEFADAAGRTFTRGTIVESATWQRLQAGQDVGIKYLPDDPDYSRLLVGDADDKHQYDPRLTILLAPVLALMALGFLACGILMFYGVDVDGWINRRLGTQKSARKRS